VALRSGARCKQRKIRNDPRMKATGYMPFDGKRMVFGGLVPLLDA
jgi:uncharacterized protein YbaA (DUF1428 family)